MYRQADILDQAETHREMELQAILKNRQPYSSGLKPDGVCHCCNAEIEEPRLFCDAKCSAVWSRENER